MRGVEAALHVLEAVRKGAFASEKLRRIADEMAGPDLTLASSLVYIVQRRRELWQTLLDGFLGKNGKNKTRESGAKQFENLPEHVQDCLLVGAGGLLELRHFASAVLVNAILNELRNMSQSHGERRERWVPLVNAVLRGVSERGAKRLESLRKSPELESRALCAGVPVWSLPAWSRTWSRAELNKLFELMPQSPSSALRVAPGHHEKEKVLKSLESAGIEFCESASSSDNVNVCNIVRLKSTVLPTSVPGFHDGLVTVQTEGSILVTSLVRSALETGSGLAVKARKKTARPTFVLDMCSGRGVKAGQILQECRDLNLKLECWELSEGRHRAAKREIARLANFDAGITDRVMLRSGDARKLVTDEPPDLILLDAPCSCSGTWIRKPDSKWRMDWPQFDRIIAAQKILLERAVNLASEHGGIVLYITCSLLKQENESIVAEILSRHPECTEMPVNFSGYIKSALHKGKPWGTYIWPETPWLDGFYCALILKR